MCCNPEEDGKYTLLPARRRQRAVVGGRPASKDRTQCRDGSTKTTGSAGASVELDAAVGASEVG